jgi:hypothetical protein
MSSRPVPLGALCALGGPIAIGAIAGMQSGPFAVAHDAVAAPAIVLGVTALMIPALYIATAFAGIAPPARGFTAGVGEGLRACGVALLGLVAPAAFLAATARSAEAAAALGAGSLVAAVLVGLRALYIRLFDRGEVVHRMIFAAWSGLALLLGALFWTRELV